VACMFLTVALWWCCDIRVGVGKLVDTLFFLLYFLVVLICISSRLLLGCLCSAFLSAVCMPHHERSCCRVAVAF